ncbi:hypothetical protein C8F04DRAFT_1115113 [Mycena alexandri]|uniref:Endonuclease/exonuclease/phosphatase domain-containing protein n=1 Tax=Mycena alexandri TaxID=1745969 RepID=A0AAD6SN61_9AGAR|nr:hypothetical protein C8F04DRAFT_1115113 [Mycena alexandri]
MWTSFRSSLPSTTSMFAQLSTQVRSLNKLYYYDGGKGRWLRGNVEASPDFTASSNQLRSFSLVTWNVDFMASFENARIRAAEVHKSCFDTLLAHKFIREFYHVTDIFLKNSYSTITLVPKSLAALVSAVERVPFTDITKMQRDYLYVDLEIPLPSRLLRLRIANTHLESLPGFGDKARPKQLKIVADVLTGPNVNGGLVAGDMNCISPSDQGLPEQLGLTDAWLAMAVQPTTDGTDDTGEAEGHTWGYQPRCEFPPSRLDKVLTVGELKVVGIERIGVGLKIKDKDKWVSDHYGLLAKVVFPSE